MSDFFIPFQYDLLDLSELFNFSNLSSITQNFGVAGKDISIGAGIVIQAALSDEFANASGQYFDNDSGQFSEPHRDALDIKKCDEVTSAIELMISTMSE